MINVLVIYSTASCHSLKLHSGAGTTK